MSITIDGIRIVDLPDLGAFTSDSSVVGEHAGSGRFSAGSLSGFFLPLTGGDVVGVTTVTLDLTSLPPFADATTLLVNLYASGPTPGFSIAGQTSLTTTAGTTQAKRFANPAISFWSTAIKNLPAGGLPAGTTQLQDLWTYISNNIDASNQPSSIGGALINEFDSAANGFCDGTTNSSSRAGAVYVFSTAWPVGPPPAPNPNYGQTPLTGGWPVAFSSGMSFSVAANTVVHLGLAMAVQYSTALWDSRSALLHSGTIQTAASAGATTLHVSNVVGYSSWGIYAFPVSPSNSMPVTIGANTYHVIGAAFDAAVGGVTTTLGTITLSSGIIGTDGAAGNGVVQQARAIWLDNRQQVCFSGDGATYIAADTSGTMQFYAPTAANINAALGVSGNVQFGNDLNVLGQINIGNMAVPGPGGSHLAFNSSGHPTADAAISTTGGTGTNDGTLSITAAQMVVPKLVFAVFPPSAANDAAAAAAGVPVGGVYHSGSALMIRMA